MRRYVPLLLVCALLCVCNGANASSKLAYTLSIKNNTVLQNISDRGIVPKTEAVHHALIPGESPVTGLPWEGDYLPMLVQIGNQEGNAQVNGRTIQSAGIGKRAPWGLQYADIVYEETVLNMGGTRFSALFSDCFAQGQPSGEVGPVRSTRVGQLLLREEWKSGFVYGGGFGGVLRWNDKETWEMLRQTGALEQGVLLDTRNRDLVALRHRVKGVKSPNNLSVDLIGLRNTIPTDFVSQPRPFLFADESPYISGYALTDTIHLDWGDKYTISHFSYNASQNVYTRFCGAGIKEAKWVPFTSFATVEDRSEEHQQTLTFSNVIVQRVAYTYPDNTIFRVEMQSIGQGNADIFISGRYIPGYWVRTSIADPTVFYDDQGNELVLNRGKTFIAQFPPEARCTFTGAQ